MGREKFTFLSKDLKTKKMLKRKRKRIGMENLLFAETFITEAGCDKK